MSLQTKIDEILEVSTPTGSRVFGGFTKDSDYDYIIDKGVYLLCWDVLAMVDYERLAYKSKEVYSYLFEWEDKNINFLIAKGRHYQRWLNATKKMVELSKSGTVYHNKDMRIEMFNRYKDE